MALKSRVRRDTIRTATNMAAEKKRRREGAKEEKKRKRFYLMVTSSFIPTYFRSKNVEKRSNVEKKIKAEAQSTTQKSGTVLLILILMGCRVTFSRTS